MVAVGRSLGPETATSSDFIPVGAMQGAAFIYDLTPNRAVRLVLDYQGHRRPLFWFQVGKDGSVYAGLSRATVSLSTGEAVPKGRMATLRYSDAQPVIDPTVLKKLHLSFHSSGVINSAGKRSYRSSWRGRLSKSHQLCLMLFEHPSKFPAVPKPRQRDVAVNFPIAEKKPLQGRLFVGPRGKVVAVESFDAQISLVFDVRGLDKVADLYVQLTLGHGVEGPWPPKTIVAWARRPSLKWHRRLLARIRSCLEQLLRLQTRGDQGP